jgi:hypothetical protein
MQRTTRRRFMSGLGAAAAVTAGGGGVLAAAQGGAGAARRRAAPFRAARHAQDDWLDAIPGDHRMIIDAVTPHGAGEAILFAANLYEANQSGYGLKDKDLAIVICMRHFATPFAYSDAFWAKRGPMAAGMLKSLAPGVDVIDPGTKQPPVRNVYEATDFDPMALPNFGNTLDSVLKRGTELAVCDAATHFLAGQIAKATGADADAVHKELVDSAVPGSHFVAAGVVAINRAQERGYTLIYAG